MFYVELPLIEGIDLGPRVWSWRDPRNNIDQKNIITPTSRGHLLGRQDSGFLSKQKIIPSEKEQSHQQQSTNQIEHSKIQQSPIQIETPLSPQSRSSLRILVVDDVKSIRKLFARALSNQGHSCDTACDGQECVDLFTKKSEGFPSSTPLGSLVPVPVAVDACPYDLVLMDSEMPVMNGPTATKIIRSLGFKELVVFGVTGNVLPEDVEMFMNHGVDAVLGKPLTLEKMWEEYDRIIKEKSQRSNLDLVSGERL
jgi:CheY-like chemotaxis protein